MCAVRVREVTFTSINYPSRRVTVFHDRERGFRLRMVETEIRDACRSLIRVMEGGKIEKLHLEAVASFLDVAVSEVALRFAMIFKDSE